MLARRCGAARVRAAAAAVAGLVFALVLVSSVAPARAGGDDGSSVTSPPGRWRAARPRPASSAGELTEEQREEIERLRSIGYLTGTEKAPAVSGVTVHDRARAGGGWNFYTSGHFPGAVLMDMDGKVLHEWRRDFLSVWPDRGDDAEIEGAQSWRCAHLFENGDVLAVYDGLGLVKLDKNSEVLWSFPEAAHHDVEVLEDGTIYVLTRRAHVVSRVNPARPILEDFIAVLDPDGRKTREFSVLEAFERSRYSNMPACMSWRRYGDIFHTNSIEVLDGSLADRLPGFAEGNVLISMRTLSLIAVIDMEREEVVWALTGLWLAQHQPVPLPSGRILVFDNRGADGLSRVIELDPVTQEIVWEYSEPRRDRVFATEMCGANQRLPNGNTLITESDAGRAFEVTPGGEIVWEYLNPERASGRVELIATLFEMVRLPPDFPVEWSHGG